MKKYGELIQFEPVTTIIKLKESAEQHKAQQLVASYVISDKMSLKLADIIIHSCSLKNHLITNPSGSSVTTVQVNHT